MPDDCHYFEFALRIITGVSMAVNLIFKQKLYFVLKSVHPDPKKVYQFTMYTSMPGAREADYLLVQVN